MFTGLACLDVIVFDSRKVAKPSKTVFWTFLEMRFHAEKTKKANGAKQFCFYFELASQEMAMGQIPGSRVKTQLKPPQKTTPSKNSYKTLPNHHPQNHQKPSPLGKKLP